MRAAGLPPKSSENDRSCVSRNSRQLQPPRHELAVDRNPERMVETVRLHLDAGHARDHLTAAGSRGSRTAGSWRSCRARSTRRRVGAPRCWPPPRRGRPAPMASAMSLFALIAESNTRSSFEFRRPIDPPTQWPDRVPQRECWIEEQFDQLRAARPRPVRRRGRRRGAARDPVPSNTCTGRTATRCWPPTSAMWSLSSRSTRRGRPL